MIQNEDYFHSQVIHPVHISTLEKSDVIIDVECGVNHSLFLTQNGKVYACGWSADGQTGLGHYNNQHIYISSVILQYIALHYWSIHNINY